MKPEGTEAHFVLPHAVYEKYRDLIDTVTEGEFVQNAMYNVVFLYTDPENALKSGTVLYGTELDGLIAAYSNFLDKIAQEPNREEQRKMFNGAHSYFREALFARKRAGVTNPCASQNPLPPASSKVTKDKKKWWHIFGSPHS